jgi:hypothetical protein
MMVELTNRLHYRHSGRFARYFRAKILAHRAGAQAFGQQRHKVHFIDHGGILSIGDAVIRERKRLSFVPDELMGEDPEGVKRGLRQSFRKILQRKFDHLLMAHGKPWISGGKKALGKFIG